MNKLVKPRLRFENSLKTSDSFDPSTDGNTFKLGNFIKLSLTKDDLSFLNKESM
jgi:hypothetical protein